MPRLLPAAGRARADAEERSYRELEPRLEPGCDLFPAPRVHTDLAASPALAVTDEQRAATLVEIGLAQRKRFLDPQAGPPEDHERARSR